MTNRLFCWRNNEARVVDMRHYLEPPLYIGREPKRPKTPWILALGALVLVAAALLIP